MMSGRDLFLTPAARTSVSGGHAVQFYESDEALIDTVAVFLAEGVSNGELAVVLATQEHREALRFRLTSLGIDVSEMCEQSRLLIRDAEETLSTFMQGTLPDRERFCEHIGGMIEELAGGKPPRRPVRAYGEMVDVLWRRDQRQAALLLEDLWNDLAKKHSLSLSCAFAMGPFYREAKPMGFDAVSRRHARVIPPHDGFRFAEERVRREDHVLLEERARSQEIELAHRKELEEALRDALVERRRAEEALRQELAEREHVEAELRSTKEEAERASRAKSEFLAVMSHELRTPLNAIMGYEQLLSHGIAGDSTPKQLQFLGRIRLSAMHLLGLINDLLNLARIEAGTLEYQLENVLIADAIRAVEPIVEPQLLEKSLNYVADLQPALVVQADREKVHQILVNLLTNAVKFTPASGTISVAARPLPQDKHRIEIDVSDTGPGIPPDKHSTIFERFVQLDTGPSRRSAGAGLGLSISRDLARGMSGDLTVKSVPGAGSTFTLVLPRAATPLRSLQAHM